jgi:hypothetical protein
MGLVHYLRHPDWAEPELLAPRAPAEAPAAAAAAAVAAAADTRRIGAA